MRLIYILASISVLFFAILIIKQFLGKKIKDKICAICLAVSITWISLLTFRYFYNSGNLILISLLVGMTILGIYYLIEKTVGKELTLFRLPFLLSLLSAGYFAITLENIFKELYFLTGIWLLFGLIYSYRNNLHLKNFINKIVECCKKW